jgi:hypothetical protein
LTTTAAAFDVAEMLDVADITDDEDDEVAQDGDSNPPSSSINLHCRSLRRRDSLHAPPVLTA